MVDAEKLKPGDLVGVNKDSYLILETLPAEYDSRVKAMEVDERPTEQYSDVGGLDKQIQEVHRLLLYYLTNFTDRKFILYIFSVDWSRCPSYDTQREIWKLGHSTP